MYPILGRYGPFFLYSYSVVIGLGLVVSLLLVAWQASARGGQQQGEASRRLPEDWLDGVLVGLALGLVGGRVGFVLGAWDYFLERPAEAWRLWQGGLSYHGGLAGGLLGLWLWAWWGKRPFTTYAGLLAPAFPLANAFGWLACWLAGCAYGAEAVMTGAFADLLLADLPDNFGVYALRYQTQLWGLISSLVVWVIVLALARRRPPGRLLWLALAGVSIGRLLISLGRGDPSLMVGSFRLDTCLDASLAILSVLLLQYQQEPLNHKS